MTKERNVTQQRIFGAPTRCLGIHQAGGGVEEIPGLCVSDVTQRKRAYLRRLSSLAGTGESRSRHKRNILENDDVPDELTKSQYQSLTGLPFSRHTRTLLPTPSASQVDLGPFQTPDPHSCTQSSKRKDVDHVNESPDSKRLPEFIDHVCGDVAIT